MSFGPSHYEVLDLEADCDSQEIKTAYRKKILGAHPDKKRCGSGPAIYSIEKIQEAYRVLLDDENRMRYDALLAESYKKTGFHNAGDGLDSFSLDEFRFDSQKELFYMDCPRCSIEEGFEFSEDTLEANGAELPQGGFYIVVQCSACSLWITVTFDVAED
ncbi:LADA_0H02982g1_1 [Lachancea dasiensis]|uniref:Diphthamide biosynthesis protein 4 n=1 Tax=Lachancea dasiensis TaxID=1072105 RepID=A0A1G4K001_9SACH|nr:LADA_0H02982g1_1 [Lachancea dasiensis]